MEPLTSTSLHRDVTTHASEHSQLLALPFELILEVWRYLDKKSLKSLRGTSKICEKHSTHHLFCSFTIYPHVRSFERLVQLSRQSHIARHVEELHYNTILLGLTEMINRRLASVYSAQIGETERKEVLKHAQQLHSENLRADAPFDELAQLSYLEKALPFLKNLETFVVVDATGLQVPSNELVDHLPHFYEQFVNDTCGRFEHTKLERGMFGTPRLNGGAYFRAILMSLHRASKPLERLIVRGIRWPALLSTSDFTKNRLLFDGVFSNLKHLELMQSHNPLFPGPICMARLQGLLINMVNLERLELLFRQDHEIEIKGREMRDVVNDMRCQSYFSGLLVSHVNGPLPGRLSWSSKLKELVLTGMVCSGTEMKSILRHCAASLKILVIGDLVLTPEVFDGPRSCLVNLIKWMGKRLNLEKIEIFGTMTNGGMQSWSLEPVYAQGQTDMLSTRVIQYILKGGECPLDHLAVPPGYYDLGKKTYTAALPESLESEEFQGDCSFEMYYDDDDEDGSDDSIWTDDGDHDIMFGLGTDDDLDEFENEDMLQHFMTQMHPAQTPGFIEEGDVVFDPDD